MTNLRIPGPTPCPDVILKEMGRQMINHRGPEFKKILYDVTDKLKQVFKTKNDVFMVCPVRPIYRKNLKIIAIGDIIKPLNF